MRYDSFAEKTTLPYKLQLIRIIIILTSESQRKIENKCEHFILLLDNYRMIVLHTVYSCSTIAKLVLGPALLALKAASF